MIASMASRFIRLLASAGRTVTLKVKYADFQQITRSRTGAAAFATRAELERQSIEVLGRGFSDPATSTSEPSPPLSNQG